MITLKSIKLNNFLSHSETKIDFKENYKVLIDGRSGSGKSSIVEAISWALYGTGRSDNKNLVKRGSKKAIVELLLKDDKTYYKVTREISLSGKHSILLEEGETMKSLKVSESAGVKETQELIEKKILKSSYLLFINSICYPQDNSENFIKQTTNKRKELLLEIIGSDDYDFYYNRAKEELKLISEKQARNEIDLNEKKMFIESNKNVEEKIKTNQEKLSDTKEKKEEVANEIKKEQEKLITVSAIKNSLENANKKNNEIKRSIEDLNIQLIIKRNKLNKILNVDIEQLEKKVSLLNNTKKQVIPLEKSEKEFIEWQYKFNSLLSEKPSDIDYQYEIKQLTDQIIKIAAENIITCPKCGNEIDNVSKRHTLYLEEQLEKKKEEQKKQEKARVDYAKKIEELGTKPSFDKEEYAFLKKLINELSVHESELISAKSEIKLKNEIEEDMVKIDKNIHEKENELKQNKIEISEFEENISKFSNTYDKIEELTKELREIDEKILAINEMLTIDIKTKEEFELAKKSEKKLIEERKELKNNFEALSAIKIAFSQTGVKTVVIDYLIPRLEDKINNILSRLSDFRILLSTTRDGANKNIVDGLFINIINEMGEQFDFTNYSGGERLKIIVSISEALSELQNIGFRILDELFIGLDEDSVDGFVDILDKLYDRFNQMICISHLQRIKDLFNEKILIIKNNGNSMIDKNYG